MSKEEVEGQAAASGVSPARAGQFVGGIDGWSAAGDALSRVTLRLRALSECDAEVDPGFVEPLLRGVRQAEAALAAVKARVIRAAQLHQTHKDAGIRDTGALLRDRLGLTAGQAAQQSRTASGLEVLPQTRKALTDGRLSQPHVDLIAQAAKRGRFGDGPQTEAVLLSEAERCQSVEDFRDQIKRREHDADPIAVAKDETLAYDRRDASSYIDKDGMVTWRLRWDPLSNEYWATGVHALEVPDPADTPHGKRRSPGQRRADAILEMVRQTLERGEVPDTGGRKPHVGVLVDLDSLANDAPLAANSNGGRPALPPYAAGKAAETQFSGPISADAALRICCDAAISRIVVAGGSVPIDLGRETRTWSVGQRAFIAARDGGCRGVGCDLPAGWCDVHHVRWWERDYGPTDVANGLMLCGRHHDQVHHRKWVVQLDPTTAEATWTSPDGRHAVITRPRGALPLQT